MMFSLQLSSVSLVLLLQCTIICFKFCRILHVHLSMSEPGSYFAQGHGDDVDYIEPRRVVDFHSNLRPLQISCGFNHTGAMLQYI